MALIGRAVAEIGDANGAVIAILVRKSEAGAERDLRADDAVTAIELVLLREHVHGAALALGVPTTAAGQLGHHAAWIHVHGQHVAVITIGRDHLIALAHAELHARHNSFLTDVEMTEATDEAHAVKLAGLFFEATDQQHVLVGGKFLLLRERRRRRSFECSAELGI